MNEETKLDDDNQPREQESGRGASDELRRDFLKRFGKYAVTTPAAMYLVLSPRTALPASDGG